MADCLGCGKEIGDEQAERSRQIASGAALCDEDLALRGFILEGETAEEVIG